jgi:hypothetical protein
VITDGHVVDRALRRLGLRRSEIDHAVRLQNGDDIGRSRTAPSNPAGNSC